MRLSDDDFRQVVRHAPLVSIDMIVERDGRYLVGRRTNAPAQGKLFVPGGRIRKDERIADAFRRITRTELGLEKHLAEATFLKVDEHLYPDSMFDPDVSTHYVTLAYCLVLRKETEVQADDQHSELSWLQLHEILAHPDVHENTARYFRAVAAREPRA